MELAIPAVIAGTGLSAYGQYQAGRETRSLSRSQAAAQAADAAAAREQAKEAARLKRAEGRELLARQRVAYAGAGVSGPTPMLVLADTMDKIEQDAANIQRGGVNAYERGMQESAWTRRAGQSAYRSGLWGAGSSLMTGLGTAAFMGYESGMFQRTPRRGYIPGRVW